MALLFSVSDLDAIANTSTGLPLAELFRNATQSRGGGFILTFMLFAAVGPCLIGSQLSMGRVFWSFSRDGGLPFSKVYVENCLPADFALMIVVGAKLINQRVRR